MLRVACLVLFVASLSTACGGDEEGVSPTPKPVSVSKGVRVDAIVPSRVSVEGGDVARLYGERLCEAPEFFLDGVPVAVGRVSARELSFVVPEARAADAVTGVEVRVVCGDDEDSLAGALIYDPALVVLPQVVGYGPTGDEARRDTSVWVQFNRAMDPASLQGRLGVEGHQGRVVWDDRTFVAAFLPDAPLGRGERVVAYLRGAEDGVRSSFGDVLAQGVSWRFRTCQTCSVALP